MKYKIYLAVFSLIILGVGEIWGQSSVRPRQNQSTAAPRQPRQQTTQQRQSTTTPQRQSSTTPGRQQQLVENHDPQVSVRAKGLFETANAVPERMTWAREIYRELNKEKEENLPLFYPLLPQGKNMNLFTLMFRLLAEGKITAYEYEVTPAEDYFTEERKINFLDILENNRINYEEDIERETRKITYKVEDSDIPSRDVESFYVKEVYGFDDVSSNYGANIIYIAPILYDSEGFKRPLFWVKYAELSPYLMERRVITSNVNNAARLTYNDFFAMQKYKGDIYQTTNLAGKPLVAMYASDTTQLRVEREKIEQQLAAFEDNLWVKKDTTQVAGTTKKKQSKTAREAAVSGEEKPKKTKAPKSSGGGGSGGSTRSVRSVRR